MKVTPNIHYIDIADSNPLKMKEILLRESRALLENRANFKIEASMAQQVMFKSEFGMSMQKYVVDILKPQKPVHPKRRLF